MIDTAFPVSALGREQPRNGGSRWIGPAANGNGPAGNYRYRTTFTVPANAILSTVNVTGLWGTDDTSIAMRINGNLDPKRQRRASRRSCRSTLPADFVIGTNMLDVRLWRTSLVVTGLRVDKAVGTYQIIPEPATACLVCLGCVAFAAVHRRRRRNVCFNLCRRRNLMSRQHQLVSLSLLAAIISFASYLATGATADPLPGRDLLKFQQLPMINTTVIDPNGVPGTYQGHDELSTAYGFPNAANNVIPFYQGRFMADDFADTLSSPVVHVKWWGSYAHDFINPSMPVNKFLDLLRVRRARSGAGLQPSRDTAVESSRVSQSPGTRLRHVHGKADPRSGPDSR